jgi:hypothetical protein
MGGIIRLSPFLGRVSDHADLHGLRWRAQKVTPQKQVAFCNDFIMRAAAYRIPDASANFNFRLLSHKRRINMQARHTIS